MNERTKAGGLVLLAATGILGFMPLLEKAMAKSHQMEEQEISAIYDDVHLIQKITGGEWTTNGQELLNGLNVNYKLSENEQVNLVAGGKMGAYVHVGYPGAVSYSAISVVNKSTLEKYIASHKDLIPKN